jgi:exopolyphosphatase/guanosine-5'-triphosphate,3'-diphosphate pyrophosphatase
MKLAALDLGSNSFHLLVAEACGTRELLKIGSQKEVLRLGSVVLERGQLSQEAFDAAFASVSRMTQAARELKAEKLLVVATSALRDARNGQAFCAACRDRLGVEVELLSGEDEARLAYWGARSALGSLSGRALLADVGGGSVELAAGNGKRCDVVHSLPLGFLRLAHAFPLHERGGARRLARYVQLECEKVRFQLGRGETLLLSGGSARALRKLSRARGELISQPQMLSLCHELSELTPAELRQQGVHPERASVLAAGAAVISGVISALGPGELCVSSGGLREGVLLRELSERVPPRAA